MNDQMELTKKKKKEKLEITREEWDIMREFRKAPYKERFIQMEAFLNTS